MSRPKREPTPEEVAVIVRMRSEWSRTLEDVRAELDQECGNPPSIGLLHRWVGELRQEILAATARRVRP